MAIAVVLILSLFTFSLVLTSCRTAKQIAYSVRLQFFIHQSTKFCVRLGFIILPYLSYYGRKKSINTGTHSKILPEVVWLLNLPRFPLLTLGTDLIPVQRLVVDYVV